MMKLLNTVQPLDVLQNKLVSFGKKEQTILISDNQNIMEVQKMVKILFYALKTLKRGMKTSIELKYITNLEKGRVNSND